MIRLTAILISSLILSGSPLLGDPADTEGRLVPVVGHNTPGAHESTWIVETYLHNHSDEPIVTSNVVECLLSAVGACDTVVPPRSSIRLGGAPSRPYEYWSARPDQVDSFTISAFVRNVGADVDPWGTAIPTPRLSEFLTGPLRLLPLPAESDYRLSLRVFTHPGDPTYLIPHVDVEIWTVEKTGARLEEQNLLGTRRLSLVSDPGRVQGGYTEAHSILTDLAIPEGSQIAIVIRTPSPTTRIWAFASLTHNSTHHVTVFEP